MRRKQKNMKKRILVYPCGTEIGLEIYRSLNKSTHYEIWGGSCSYDHGRFVYENHIDELPYIVDASTSREVERFDEIIRGYDFDYIYPSMDGVLTVFAKYREKLKPIVIAPDIETAEITRSKKKTYQILKNFIPTPDIYTEPSIFPVFLKPDSGQGAVGTKLIYTRQELNEAIKVDRNLLILEYLPGREYTIDCFTNVSGELIYAEARERKRIKNGISVNTVFKYNPVFIEYANKINAIIRQKGAWFFQMKEDKDGNLKLLEVASRIAGTSAISRIAGVNLPLLTIHLYDGNEIDSVIMNPGYKALELDRALYNCFCLDISYDTVYVDYDDTLIVDGKINVELISFLYQSVNEQKRIILLTKHDGNIMTSLSRWKIKEIFDEIIPLENNAHKSDYVKQNSIFIDDSYGERREVFEKCDVPVFDTHMIEGLMKGKNHI